MTQAKVDRWVGSLCVIGGVFWSYTAYTSISGHYDPPSGGPQVFPVLLGALLAVLGVLLVAIGFFSERASSSEAQLKVDALTCHEIRIVISTFALLLLYGFMLEKLGFLIASPLAIVAIFVGILKIYSWRLIVSMVLGLTIGSYVVFGLLVGTYLPRGTWLQSINF